MENIFTQATRQKLRFESVQGLLSTEDLWDLPLQSTRQNVATLDAVAKTLNKQIKDMGEESFVTPAASVKDTQTHLKFEIVKAVIAVKIEENTANKLKADKQAEKARILEIIGRKKDAELEGASLEELQARLASL